MSEEKKPCRGCRGNKGMVQDFSNARVMPDNSVMYPKKGNEPPPDLDGYQRSPGNPWKFIPMWKACAWRTQYQFLKPCGALGVMSICQHAQCPVADKQVLYRDCITCTLPKTK